MNTDGNIDMEDLGNEALVFAYGHNVNLYEDVFSIANTASIQEIHLTYTGLLKEIEVAQYAFQDCNDQDVQKRHAMRLGMKETHFAVGVHPRDFLDIKMDAVKRAYDILADKKSRREYDDCLREYMESFENAQGADVGHVSDVSSGEDEEDDDMSNDGDDSLYDVSSVQAQVEDSDFPILSSHHHDNDVFDPFNLQDDMAGHYAFSSFQDNTFDSIQDAAPISPDIDSAFSASFSGLHPHGHEMSVRICALPHPDSEDDSSVDSDYTRKAGLEPEADIHLTSRLSSEEEDELISFRELSKSMSDLDEKQSAFFNQMDVGLDNVECFSEDDSDIVDHEDVDNMSIASETKEKELDEFKEQSVWICLDDLLDDTAITIEQMCGMGK
jgi:curved DNA-binding protein CbpA